MATYNGAGYRTVTQVEARAGGTGWWYADALISTPVSWWTAVLNSGGLYT